MPTHRYYFLNRPPGIATHPKGETRRQVWFPSRPMPGQVDRRVLGWVEYPEPLTHEQIWKWELAPADMGEQAEHVFWLDGRYDDDPEWLKKDYLAQPIDDLKRAYTEWKDDKAWAALILKGVITA